MPRRNGHTHGHTALNLEALRQDLRGKRRKGDGFSDRHVGAGWYCPPDSAQRCRGRRL